MCMFPAKLLLNLFMALTVSAVFIILIAFTVVGFVVVVVVIVVAIMPLSATKAAVYHPVCEAQM